MNRVLAAALELLNYVIVLAIIAGGGYAGWLFFQGDPEAQNLGIFTGVVLGILVAAVVGGAVALVVLIEKHLRVIRANTIRQTELLEHLAEIAKSDAQGPAAQPGDGGFGAPAWARTGQG
jgi:hypothetical protein